MNNGAFGENFPYSNFHDLNMDWIIKIAKDFLDQYTNIQQIIADGETSLENLTNEGLQQLQEKADNLSALLQQWYDTHSEDIANQLATALEDIATTTDEALQNILSQFNTTVDKIVAEAIDSIPYDYNLMYENVNSISERTGNLFNNAGIAYGKNAVYVDTANRAISQIIDTNGEGSVIYIKTLPQNVKTELQYYNSNTYDSWTSHSSSEITTTKYEFIPTDRRYIALLFMPVTGNLTENDLIGLEVCITKTFIQREFIPYRSAVDWKIRIDELKEESLSKSPLNFKNVDWQNIAISNGADGNPTFVRVCSGMIEIPMGISIVNNSVNINGYVEMYDGNRTFQQETSFNAGSHVSTLWNTKYIRFYMRTNPESNITLEDVYKKIIPYIDYYDVHDMIPNMKLLTFNLGLYNYGVRPAGLPDDELQDRIIDYRRFFGEQKADIMGFQEWKYYIDRNDQYSANDVLYNYLYPYRYFTGNWCALHSKFWTGNDLRFTLGANNRNCVRTIITREGKSIAVFSVHLSPGYDQAGANARNEEAQELITILSNFDSFIVFGDFNPSVGEEDSLYGLFTTAGMNIANCGYFGKFDTLPNEHGYVDNIITSSDIKIVNAYTVNTYSELTSDHIPLIAEVTI